MKQLAAEGASNSSYLDELKKLQISANMSNDYKFYMLICGLFSPERHIVKNWTKHEQIFLSLVEADGKIGVRHLL